MSCDEHINLAPEAVLVVGAGLAGLFAALELAPRPVYILAPGSQKGRYISHPVRSGKDSFGFENPDGDRPENMMPDGSSGTASAWAQGGVAAALGPEDSPELHAQDTLRAGAGLCFPAAVDILTQEAPQRLEDLKRLGVPFDGDGEDWQLSLEAAHSHARIARVGGDLAGLAIMDTLLKRARLAPHIQPLLGWRAQALSLHHDGSIGGVQAIDGHGAVMSVRAQTVVLATGGIGGLYAVTTNPRTALGEGLAIAALAGALCVDLPFVQFHPTAFEGCGDPAPLATEALRGAGALLVNADGRRFMPDYDGRAELAPRDCVARAVASEKQAGRGAYLDGRIRPGPDFPEEFPTVFKAARRAGFDPRTDLIPIAPAAHYHMGGIATDLWGRTSVAGLWALGECACTGLHGANRLASNSLSEALVFSYRAAQAIKRTPPPQKISVAPVPAPFPVSLGPEAMEILRGAMMEKAGVVRDQHSLEAGLKTLDGLEREHGPALALTSARLVLMAALGRRESRGAHWRRDYPDENIPERIFYRLENGRDLKQVTQKSFPHSVCIS